VLLANADLIELLLLASVLSIPLVLTVSVLEHLALLNVHVLLITQLKLAYVERTAALLHVLA